MSPTPEEIQKLSYALAKRTCFFRNGVSDSDIQLFSAAPDLLEACKEAKLRFEVLMDAEEETTEDKAAYGLVCAAIEKAEGKS